MAQSTFIIRYNFRGEYHMIVRHNYSAALDQFEAIKNGVENSPELYSDLLVDFPVDDPRYEDPTFVDNDDFDGYDSIYDC